jgi:tetratricopeptide (TPR) repeat protein
LTESVLQLESLVNHGRYLEARELAFHLRENLEADPLRVDQLLALSLSKSGSPESALAHLDLAYRRNPNDPETAGILGGIYKELFKKHQDSKYAILSRDTYSRNFEATRNYYTGINAATMSAIAGRARQGREIAEQVISVIDESGKGFWEWATLGEAYLLTKDRTASIEHYIKARQLAGNDWGKVISVYNQLWLLNHYIPVSKEIMRIFSPPTVVAFIGHMIDHPARSTPRFPAVIESQVRESMAGALRTMNAGIGYCSLACGSDILFVEAMEQSGAEVHIFIPFAKTDFINASVRFAGDQWVERFERLTSKFPVSYITEDGYDGHDDLFAFQCKIIFGSAMLRSMAYHQEPMLLTVQSEMDLKRKEGGTRDTIRLWPLPERHISINPDPFVVTLPPVNVSPPSPATVVSINKTNRPVLYLVLTDLTHTPGMEKEKVYKMINNKMKDGLIPYTAFDIGPDSVFMAFEAETGALDFVQEVLNATPTVLQERSTRISLHAGPVYLETLPSKENIVKEGENTALIRNISQLTPKGHICASDTFAALLALNPKKFRLDYAGILSASENQKSYGIYNVTFKG